MGLAAVVAAIIFEVLVPASAKAGSSLMRVTLSAPGVVRPGHLAEFSGLSRSAHGAQVVVQRHSGRRWVTFVVGHAAEDGRFRFGWPVPATAKSATVRAAVLGYGRTLAVSHPRRLTVDGISSRAAAMIPTAASTAQVIAAPTVTQAPPQGQPGTLVYSGSDQVEPGSLIDIGESSATPDGLIAKVTGVSTVNGQTTASVVPASLSELLANGSFDETLTIPYTQTAIRLRENRRDPAKSEVTCSGSAETSITAEVSLTGSIEAYAHFGGFRLNSAGLVAHASANATLAADAQASGACKLERTKIATLHLPRFEFDVSGFPVVVTTDVPVYVDAAASLSAATSAEMDGGFDAAAGIQWTSSGGFSPVIDFTPKLTFAPPTVTADASMNANLLPEIDADVDGIGEVDVDLSAGLAFDADPSANPWWSLTVPVDVSGSLGLDLGVKTLESGSLSLYHHRFALATAGGPFTAGGSTTPTATPTTATPTTAPPAPTPTPGTLSVVAGDGSSGTPTAGPATLTDLGRPTDVAVDTSGNLFISDISENVVEEVTPAGQLSIIAGILGESGLPTPGPATSSELDLSGECGGIAVDSQDDVYVADCGNDDVAEVTPAGQLSVVAGVTGQSGPPTAGPASQSDLDDPSGVAVDAGNLYIADSGNNVVEKVTPANQLSVIAGVIGESGAPTPGPATSSEIGSSDLTADSDGDVFVADTDNNVVEEITPAGELKIVAGVVGASGTPTPGPATSSDLDFGGCGQVAVDDSGNLYIADCGNAAAEEVTAAGVLSVIAGVPGESGPPTPGPSTNSELGGPTGIAVSSLGDVFIADASDADVEEVMPSGG